jgi:hypothetical protein
MKVCSHERGKFSNLLNKLIPEFVGCAPVIILTDFFFRLSIFLLSDELPLFQKLNYSLFYYRVSIDNTTNPDSVIIVSVLLANFI